MSATHFHTTCGDLIKLAVESLASARYLTAAQQRSRGQAVVNTIMAFMPSEPVQVMLASQAAGHHFSLMDTFQQIHDRSLTAGISVRMRAISAMETRMTLALVRELRTVRREMLAAAQAERLAMAASTDPVSEPPAPVPGQDVPETAPPTAAEDAAAVSVHGEIPTVRRHPAVARPSAPYPATPETANPRGWPPNRQASRFGGEATRRDCLVADRDPLSSPRGHDAAAGCALEMKSGLIYSLDNIQE